MVDTSFGEVPMMYNNAAVICAGNNKLYNRSWLIRGYVRPVTKIIVQELCESRGGRPGLSVLTSLLVSVDVKLY